MILDLEKFLGEEKPYWDELEGKLVQIERDLSFRMELEEIRRFYYLYNRVAADLTKISTFSGDTEIRRYLENLVARGYGYIHEARAMDKRYSWFQWLTQGFPRVFRKHFSAFLLSLGITLVGVIFGALVLSQDSTVKEVIMPFPHLLLSPAERVAMEEEGLKQEANDGVGLKGSFAAELMRHNIKVSISLLAFGMSAALGTAVMLFYNGVILGSVCFDYIAAGYHVFLMGWLLPHGVIEIPAILIAGQGGLILGRAIIGWGDGMPLRARLRYVASDVVVIVGGVAVMLVWAGLVEAFLSQYHEPVIPYIVKILFGCVELLALGFWLGKGGSLGKKNE